MIILTGMFCGEHGAQKFAECPQCFDRLAAEAAVAKARMNSAIHERDSARRIACALYGVFLNVKMEVGIEASLGMDKAEAVLAEERELRKR